MVTAEDVAVELRLARKADGKVKIGAAEVTGTDIKCTNGVIHVIDTVLMPGN